MKFLLIFSLFLGVTTWAKETELLTRTYKVRIQAGNVTCREGVPPNGHNYPVPTSLSFSLPAYDLWGADIWTNVDEYNNDSDYEHCSKYANLLRPPPEQNLIGTVTQKISDSYTINGNNNCMRVTREEATLVVDGVTMKAAREFMVGPISAAQCR